MKKIFVVLTIAVLTLTSFKLNNSFPCHPDGDIGPCLHFMHFYGDIGPCTHPCINAWGNTVPCHPKGDKYPCTHTLHTADLYVCNHFCW